jgi:hypothetical protein
VPSGRRSRKRPWGEEHPDIDLERARGGSWIQERAGRRWTVRSVTGSKPYRCPGCGQEIPPGTPHVVVWAQDGLFGAESALEDRRHWHRGCWRSDRGVG